MTENIVLFDNEWVQLKEMRCPEKGVNGYVYSHEKRCNGNIIAILPYGHIDKVLIRREVTPCWGMHREVSSITGGVDPGQNAEQAAVVELKEEAGYSISELDLINLGWCRGTKSCDTKYHLFSVCLDGLKEGEAPGDGSELESQADCKWLDKSEVFHAVDPILHCLLARLDSKIARGSLIR